MRFLNYAGGVFILLLLALGCKPEAKRSRVLVIQSFRWDDKNYLELNSDIRKELRKNRVNADIRTFYLDCECYMAEEEEERMYNFIDTIRLWKVKMKRPTPPKPAPIGDRYVCSGCGYEYVPELGDEDGEIAPGTLFEQLPAEWVCPECAETKDQFVKA